jgi:antitoxin PrlF
MRMNPVSRVTSKFQATIPAPVRAALGLKQGDVIAFEVKDGVVRLTRANPRDIAFAQAVEGTLCEWDGAADNEAFRGL